MKREPEMILAGRSVMCAWAAGIKSALRAASEGPRAAAAIEEEADRALHFATRKSA